MATYVIGDVQGCYYELHRLLSLVKFDSLQDTLWFTGDIVSRGPMSLETLRFVRSLGRKAVCVLGNHDLHLLAAAEGYVSPHASIVPILDAPDKRVLLDWLRSRPLLHHDENSGYTLIHAGLPPQWDLLQAIYCAQEVQAVLHTPHFREMLSWMYGDEPDMWSEDLADWDRLRFIINALTRLRYCHPDGRLALSHKEAPGKQTEGLIPWFEMPDRQSQDEKIIFGHWSTLGFYQGNGVIGLDSGCLWGGSITAMRLEDGEFFNVPCPEACTPGEPC